MSARRIARELAVILLPQLPKDSDKLSKIELDQLAVRAVQMLSDYAKQCLADANAFVVRSRQEVLELEMNHPDNSHEIEHMAPVSVTTKELKEHLDNLERALHLTSEALDIPQMSIQQNDTIFLYDLVRNYVEHKEQIDQFIGKAKAKWRIERMVSIDRDILRLACAEAFYMPDVPINVTISEAVELSHRFADDRAARFINGILGDLADIAKDFRRTGKMVDLDTTSGDSDDSSVTSRHA